MYAACLLLHVGNRDVLSTPRLCVQPMIESGIIQDAQQEAFIWLSLCLAASADINQEIDSCSLFCHSSVRGRGSQQTCCIYISFLEHLFSEERRSGGRSKWHSVFSLAPQSRRGLILQPCTAPLGEEKLLFIPSPPTGDPGRGLKANPLGVHNPESASLLRLPLLR